MKQIHFLFYLTSYRSVGAKKGISSVSERMEDLFILSFLLRSSNLSFSPFPGTEGLKTAGTAYLTSDSSSADSATEMNYKCCGTCRGWSRAIGQYSFCLRKLTQSLEFFFPQLESFPEEQQDLGWKTWNFRKIKKTAYGQVSCSRFKVGRERNRSASIDGIGASLFRGRFHRGQTVAGYEPSGGDAASLVSASRSAKSGD